MFKTPKKNTPFHNIYILKEHLFYNKQQEKHLSLKKHLFDLKNSVDIDGRGVLIRPNLQDLQDNYYTRRFHTMYNG